MSCDWGAADRARRGDGARPVGRGPDDVITPAAAVEAGAANLTGAASVRYETATGGHLGILTGDTARDTTWAAIDKFLAELR